MSAGEAMRPRAFTLYRFWSADDRLLYVGITGDPRGRWGHHSTRKPWWRDVSRITVEHFDSRAELKKAEASAIQAEQPQHNIVHKRVRPAPRPARLNSPPEPTYEIEEGYGLPQRMARVVDAWLAGRIPASTDWPIRRGDVFVTRGSDGTPKDLAPDRLHETLMSLGGPEVVRDRFGHLTTFSNGGCYFVIEVWGLAGWSRT